MKKRLIAPEVSSLDFHPLVAQTAPSSSVRFVKDVASQQLDSFVTRAILPLVSEINQQMSSMNATRSNRVSTPPNYATRQIQKTMQAFRGEQKTPQKPLHRGKPDSVYRSEKLKSVAEQQGQLYSFGENVKAGFFRHRRFSSRPSSEIDSSPLFFVFADI